MSDYRQCPLCGESGFFTNARMQRHRCKPEWQCRGAWENWLDADWSSVRAGDAEEAAEKFCEDYDRDVGEYAIACGRVKDSLVYVRQPVDPDFCGPHEAEAYSVVAEAVAEYYGSKIERRAS